MGALDIGIRDSGGRRGVTYLQRPLATITEALHFRHTPVASKVQSRASQGLRFTSILCREFTMGTRISSVFIKSIEI